MSELSCQEVMKGQVAELNAHLSLMSIVAMLEILEGAPSSKIAVWTT
jgi:hypothetical protein